MSEDALAVADTLTATFPFFLGIRIRSVLILSVSDRAVLTSFLSKHFAGNEEHVGKAIRESGIPREEIFVTTKLP